MRERERVVKVTLQFWVVPVTVTYPDSSHSSLVTVSLMSVPVIDPMQLMILTNFPTNNFITMSF